MPSHNNFKYQKHNKKKYTKQKKNSLRVNGPMVIMNKNHPAFAPGYTKITCNTYGTSEFNARICADSNHTSGNKYSLYMYLVDQYFDQTYSKNIHLFKVSIGFLCPAFPNNWKQRMVNSLNQELQSLEIVHSSSEYIYYYMLSAYISFNSYWKQCQYETRDICAENNTFCQKKHGDMHDEMPEYSLTGHHRDEPGYSKEWRWIPMVEDRDYEKTADYFAFIKNNTWNVLQADRYKDLVIEQL